MNMAMNPMQTRASATVAKPAPGSIIFDKVSVVFETAKLTAVQRPLPDGALRLVSRGVKEDPAPAA
jgi:hypothetical protein